MLFSYFWEKAFFPSFFFGFLSFFFSPFLQSSCFSDEVQSMNLWTDEWQEDDLVNRLFCLNSASVLPSHFCFLSCYRCTEMKPSKLHLWHGAVTIKAPALYWEMKEKRRRCKPGCAQEHHWLLCHSPHLVTLFLLRKLLHRYHSA